MNLYRYYVLSSQDRVDEEKQQDFDDDRSAVQLARRLRGDRYAVEVWTGERLVARLGGELQI
jgi:hypothetical protein